MGGHFNSKDTWRIQQVWPIKLGNCRHVLCEPYTLDSPVVNQLTSHKPTTTIYVDMYLMMNHL